MIFQHFVHSSDSSLGRLDYDSLSDQARMEILIDGLTAESKKYYKDDNGNYIDVCDWRGVSCDTEGHIVKISRLDLYISGSVDLAFIPPHVICFGMDFLQSTGTLETSKLPRKIQEFDISQNKFHGTVEMAGLPDCLEELNISSNAFTGSVALDKLPAQITEVDLSNNMFSGSIDLNNLPERLSSLDISRNAFSGEFVLTKAPQTLDEIFANRNQFCGNAIVMRNCEVQVSLEETGVKEIVDENGKPHPKAEEFLR